MGSGLRQSIGFLKHPRKVASFFETSQWSAPKILQPSIEATRDEASRILVEFGPGGGVLTRYAIEHNIVREQDLLIAIEIVHSFVLDLLKEFEDEPRVQIVEGSAADVRQILDDLDISEANHVVSGIPFTQIPEDIGRHIVSETKKILAPEGTFTTYQFRSTARQYQQAEFQTVEKRFSLFNLPPLLITHSSHPINWLNSTKLLNDEKKS